MKKKRNKTPEIEFSILLESEGVIEMLKQLREQGRVRWTEFTAPVSKSMLDLRLRRLKKFELIQHFFTRKEKRREWYEITEEGKRILEVLEKSQ